MNIKTFKKLALLVLVLGLVVTLSGCAKIDYAHMKPPTGFFYGTIYNIFGHPLQNLILYVSKVIGGTNGAGWGIALVSFVVRLILLPLMLRQSFKSTRQQEIMKSLKPQLDLVQNAAKTPGITQEQSLKINQLSMNVYKENNLSMIGGMGCLPLLLQFPIMIGIYQAVVYSKELFSASFFGISLGKPSMLITIIATLLYVVQGYLTTIGIPEEQKKTMQTMLLMSPLMTFFISVQAPAALALYFLVGGVIVLIQQLIVTFVIMPKVKQQVDRELTENPLKVVVSKEIINEIIKTTPAAAPTSTNTSEAPTTNGSQPSARERNAGKQQHPKD